MSSKMENETELIPTLPSETWELIFDFVKNSYTENQAKLQYKAIANLREVCRYFRDMVNEHVCLDFELTNEFLKRNRNLQHVRVNKCLLSDLMEPIEPNQLPVFLNTSMVSEIAFGKLVTKENFYVVAKHFGSAKQVKISEGFRSCDIFVPTPEKETIFTTFWANVEKLELDVPPIELRIQVFHQDRNMIEILNTAHLPKLTTFRISAYSNLMVSNLLRSFLGRHGKTLRNVYVKSEPFLECFDEVLFRKETEIDKELCWKEEPNISSSEDLKDIELQRLCIEGGKMSEVVRKSWMPIIMAQKGLVQLKLSNVGELWSNVGEPLSFSDFVAVLQSNMSTLTSLELTMFHFGEIVDFKIFQPMRKLQFLKLYKMNDGTVSRIVNLTNLPDSLEHLEMIGFSVMSSQLKQLSKVLHLESCIP